MFLKDAASKSRCKPIRWVTISNPPPLLSPPARPADSLAEGFAGCNRQALPAHAVRRVHQGGGGGVGPHPQRRPPRGRPLLPNEVTHRREQPPLEAEAVGDGEVVHIAPLERLQRRWGPGPPLRGRRPLRRGSPSCGTLTKPPSRIMGIEWGGGISFPLPPLFLLPPSRYSLSIALRKYWGNTPRGVPLAFP